MIFFSYRFLLLTRERKSQISQFLLCYYSCLYILLEKNEYFYFTCSFSLLYKIGILLDMLLFPFSPSSILSFDRARSVLQGMAKSDIFDSVYNLHVIFVNSLTDDLSYSSMISFCQPTIADKIY